MLALIPTLYKTPLIQQIEHNPEALIKTEFLFPSKSNVSLAFLIISVLLDERNKVKCTTKQN